MNYALYEPRLTGALRGKRTAGSVYVLDRDGRVLLGNGKIETGAYLLEALGVSKTERAELSLHLTCGAREAVMLSAKRRPVIVCCGLYASAGVLVVYVPQGAACLDTGATLAAFLEDIVLGSRARQGEREADAALVAEVTSEYAHLQAVTGRGHYTPSERLEAVSRLTGCGIYYDLTPFERDEADAVLAMQTIVLIAAMRAMRVGTRTLTLSTLRDRGRAVLVLEARDKTPNEAFTAFDGMLETARVRGDLFALTRDPDDACVLHLTATLTRAELSFQGVKEPDGLVHKDPIPVPIAIKGENGELVL